MAKYIQVIVALATINCAIAIIPEVKAQENKDCYMIDSSGEYIDLSSLCSLQSSPRISQNNSIDSQSASTFEKNTQSSLEVQTYVQELETENLNSRQLITLPTSNHYYNPTGGNYRQRKLFRRLQRGRSVNPDLSSQNFD